jgi:hypothetical protein
LRTILSRLFAASIISFASGCSIAPDISDVTPLDTAAVVRHIECETRIAILQNIAAYIQANAKDKNTAAVIAAVFGDSDLISILEKLRLLKVEALYKLGKGDPELADYIAAWDTVVIGFGYTFDITEDNNNSGGLSFNFPAGIHAVKLGATAGLQNTRQNKKEFTIVASVANLMQSKACLSPDMVALNRAAVPNYSPIGYRGTPDAETRANIERSQTPNPIHPITGSIGMADVLGTFGSIWRGTEGGQSRATALQPRKVAKSPYGLLPGNLTEDANDGGYIQTLAFTTKISGKINPTIEVAGSNLTSGTFTSDNSRTDKHQLIVKISAPSPAEIAASIKRSEAVRKANEYQIAAALANITANANAVAMAAAPSINTSIDHQRQLLALERFGGVPRSQ